VISAPSGQVATVQVKWLMRTPLGSVWWYILLKTPFLVEDEVDEVDEVVVEEEVVVVVEEEEEEEEEDIFMKIDYDEISTENHVKKLHM